MDINNILQQLIQLQYESSSFTHSRTVASPTIAAPSTVPTNTTSTSTRNSITSITSNTLLTVLPLPATSSSRPTSPPTSSSTSTHNKRAYLYDTILFIYKNQLRNSNADQFIQDISITNTLIQCILNEFQCELNDTTISVYASALRIATICFYYRSLSPSIDLAESFYIQLLQLFKRVPKRYLKLITNILWFFNEHHYYCTNAPMDIPFTRFILTYIDVTSEKLQDLPYCYIIIIQWLQSLSAIIDQIHHRILFKDIQCYFTRTLEYLFETSTYFHASSCLQIEQSRLIPRDEDAFSYISQSEKIRIRRAALSLFAHLDVIHNDSGSIYTVLSTQDHSRLLRFFESITQELSLVGSEEIRLICAESLRILLIIFHTPIFELEATFFPKFLACCELLFSDSSIMIQRYTWERVWPLFMQYFEVHKKLLSTRTLKLLLKPVMHTIHSIRNTSQSLSDPLLAFWNQLLHMSKRIKILSKEVFQNAIDPLVYECKLKSNNHKLCQLIIDGVELYQPTTGISASSANPMEEG